jgi:hypothetical protein
MGKREHTELDTLTGHNKVTQKKLIDVQTTAINSQRWHFEKQKYDCR